MAVTPPAIAPRLLQAYRATDYAVGSTTVRIGRRSPAMDSVLSRLGTRTGVLVTAWNPLSRPMPHGWNRRMQRCLEQRLRRRPMVPASGTLGRWYEVHCLVAGDPRPVLQLARLFRQTAVVLLTQRQPARLALLRRNNRA